MFQMRACIYLLSETTVARVPKITSPGQLLRNSCAVKWLERTKAETDLRQHTWVRTPGGCVLLLPTADPQSSAWVMAQAATLALRVYSLATQLAIYSTCYVGVPNSPQTRHFWRLQFQHVCVRFYGGPTPGPTFRNLQLAQVRILVSAFCFLNHPYLLFNCLLIHELRPYLIIKSFTRSGYQIRTSYLYQLPLSINDQLEYLKKFPTGLKRVRFEVRLE